MIVYKFGGSSQATAERMKAVADIVTRDENQKVVVLSAVAGTTDALIKLASLPASSAKAMLKEMIDQYLQYVDDLLNNIELTEKAWKFIEDTFSKIEISLNESSTRDEKWFVAHGELISSYLFNLLLEERGVNATLLPALSFMQTCDGEPEMVTIKTLLSIAIKEAGEHSIYVTQGYICKNEHKGIDNLRRGGSDYSATIIGAALNADEIQIWTDIDGVHNNDPRIVKKTSRIDELSYAEAAELAYFGAKILHPLCVRPAREAGVPIRLLNTLNPESEGTIIHRENLDEAGGVKAVAAKDGITAINIRSSHMLMAHGFLKKIFDVFENHQTSVDMITTAEVAVSLTIDDDSNLDKIVKDLEHYGVITVDKEQTIVCVVGAFRKDDAGIAVQVLNPLRNIPIKMISSGGSESNISVLIDSKYKQEALEALNKELFRQQ